MHLQAICTCLRCVHDNLTTFDAITLAQSKKLYVLYFLEKLFWPLAQLKRRIRQAQKLRICPETLKNPTFYAIFLYKMFIEPKNGYNFKNKHWKL